MEVVDKQNYLCKAQKLLEQQSNDRCIPAGPNNKQNTQLINLSKRIKVETGTEENI